MKKRKIFPDDTLSPRERVERAIALEKTDRVPVAPQMGFHIARAGGISVEEFMTNGRRAAGACRAAWDRYGGFDMMGLYFPAAYAFPLVPDPHSRYWNEWHIPGGDELPMLIEKELLNSYDVLIEEGILHLAKTERGRLFKTTARMAVEAARFAFYLRDLLAQKNHYGEYAVGVVSHPADLLAMWRGFENFMLDLAHDPLKVKAACECLLDGFIEVGETTARLAGGKRILIGASRISGSFISPKMFEEIFFESFLEIVNRLHSDGFSIAFHLDNNYTQMLEYFLEFPRKCGVMHLDQTDLYHAKEVIGKHLCLMGNLHPGLLANGKPDEVEAECERLIKEVGAGGGFILANACEVPLNAPFENIHAMKRAVEKWGWY